MLATKLPILAGRNVVSRGQRSGEKIGQNNSRGAAAEGSGWSGAICNRRIPEV
jgi:hypothetical protein